MNKTGMKAKGAHLAIWSHREEDLFRVRILLVSEHFLPFTFCLETENVRRIGVHVETQHGRESEEWLVRLV